MLTPSAVQNAKSQAKAYKLHDERGLFLLVSPAGGKLWRWKYRRPDSGKENLLSFGAFPEVTLKRAREKREEARALLADGVDPGEQRKAVKAAGEERAGNSFEVIAREWFAKQKTSWADSHADKIIRRLERDLFPWIGARPISEITAPELLKQLERIEQRGAVETAHRALQNYGQVARYAIRTGREARDLSADLKGALTPWRPVNFAAATTPVDVAGILRRMGDSTSGPIVRSALLLAPLLFSRPGELSVMRWEELDMDAGQWRYFVTKTKREHVASLASQAVDILRDLHPLTGRGDYVFPGQGKDRTKPMSRDSVRMALRRCGVEKEEQTVHGFRHTASTLLNEQGWNPDAIEAALTHRMPGVRGVYAGRAQYLEERKKMMQAWADYLDALRTGTNVVSIRRNG